MKIYVNGDSHAAAAEAVNVHAFAEDDPGYFYLGRAPHPENWKVSWARRLADAVQASLHSDAESASSNARIMRTTRAWMADNHRWLPETVMIIQWSTWEREEWLIDGTYYQVTASGTDDVPETHRDRYRKWVIDVDWRACAQHWHTEIWNLHQELKAQQIRHVFFNGNNSLRSVEKEHRHDWGINYIEPYHPDHTYDSWLKQQGHKTVSPESWHFGSKAHAKWAQFMLQYGIKHQLWR